MVGFSLLASVALRSLALVLMTMKRAWVGSPSGAKSNA